MLQVRAPLVRMFQSHGIRRLDLGVMAGVDLKVVHRLCRDEFNGMKIGTLTRVARTLAVAAPELALMLVRKSEQ